MTAPSGTFHKPKAWEKTSLSSLTLLLHFKLFSTHISSIVSINMGTSLLYYRYEKRYILAPSPTWGEYKLSRFEPQHPTPPLCTPPCDFSDPPSCGLAPPPWSLLLTSLPMSPLWSLGKGMGPPCGELKGAARSPVALGGDSGRSACGVNREDHITKTSHSGGPFGHVEARLRKRILLLMRHSSCSTPRETTAPTPR